MYISYTVSKCGRKEPAQACSREWWLLSSVDHRPRIHAYLTTAYTHEHAYSAVHIFMYVCTHVQQIKSKA